MWNPLRLQAKSYTRIGSYRLLTIIEWGPPVKHDTILYRTFVLLCVFRAIYTGPIHINHGLYGEAPYNVPANAFLHFTISNSYPQAERRKSIMKLQPKIKILDRVRQAIGLQNYSYSTEKAYVYWIKLFILSHNKLHKQTIGEPEKRNSSAVSPLNEMSPHPPTPSRGPSGITSLFLY